MKKAHNSHNSKKLTLNKLKVAKLENLYTINGGGNLNMGFIANNDDEDEDDGGNNDNDTWPF